MIHRKISFLLFLYCIICNGDDKTIIPTTPMNLPVFYWMTNENPQYKEAAVSAQEAFLIQTGIMEKYNNGKNLIESKVKIITQKKQKEVAEYLDKETLLNSEVIFFIVGSSYTLIIQKHITKEFGNPLYGPLRHIVTLDVENKRIFTGIKVPF